MPIVPTFLYATEHQLQNSSLSFNNQKPPKETSPSSILSLYDNTTYVLGAHTVELPDPTPRGGHNRSSPAGCQEDTDFLVEENVRVGLLFASKALVQLLVSPFVGPLTNRYADEMAEHKASGNPKETVSFSQKAAH